MDLPYDLAAARRQRIILALSLAGLIFFLAEQAFFLGDLIKLVPAFANLHKGAGMEQDPATVQSLNKKVRQLKMESIVGFLERGTVHR